MGRSGTAKRGTGMPVREQNKDQAFAETRRRIAALFDEAYEVGGAVRDELMGVECKDLDIAVRASYQELEETLRPHGRVEPNVVGGGSLVGIEWTASEGEELREQLTVLGMSYGEAAEWVLERFPGASNLRPIISGSGRLVGCRLYAKWAPEGMVEVSLLRTEKSTAPGRANFEVDAGAHVGILDDLYRRDFTVNAMARSLHTGEPIDPFGGADDVKNRILRAVSPQSFEEDPSRILRGFIRIAKDNTFRFDEETVRQIELWKDRLEVEPREQINDAIDDILKAPHAADALRLAVELDVLQNENVLPELAPAVGFDQRSSYHSFTVDEHTVAVVDAAVKLDAPADVRWAALLHDSGKPATAQPHKDGEHLMFPGHEEASAELVKQAGQRLKWSDDRKVRVRLLVAEHMFREDEEATPEAARRLLRRLSHRCPDAMDVRAFADDLLLLRRCDRTGKSPAGMSAEDVARAERFEQLIEEAKQVPLKPRELAIKGGEAVSFGFKGKEIREVLEQLVDDVIDDPSLNTPEELRRRIAERAVKHKKLGVSGHDVMALGLKGPQIGEALSALVDHVVADEKARTPEAAQAFLAAYATP